MTRPKNEFPPPPRLFPDGRGGARWLTYWTDEHGGPHTKGFGSSAVAERTAQRRYQHWLDTEWKVKPHVRNPRSAPAEYTVWRMAREYLFWARRTYRKNGKPTSHVKNIRLALRKLCEFHGNELAGDFDAPKLARLRDLMIEDGGKPKAASTVNDRLSILLHAFRWAREGGKIPAIVTNDLLSVRRVSAIRSRAKPRRKVMSVDRQTVNLTKEKMAPHLADMIELLWLTGMRPGEACDMRGCEIEAGGRDWFYVPGSWKTQHMQHLRRRVIPLGPRSIEIVTRNMPRDTTAIIFSPLRAHRQRIEARNKSGWKGEPKQITSRYTTDSLRGAILYACKAAGIEPWTPNQLRHAYATRVKKSHGADAARAVLGHTTLGTTEIYLDPDVQLAARIAREVG